jgi:NAD binding domain of 6-phosphogluconate dehydrogenase
LAYPVAESVRSPQAPADRPAACGRGPAGKPGAGVPSAAWRKPDSPRAATGQGAARVPKVTRIGLVGVGRMGLPMCANLVAAGHMVTAGDARAELERAVMQCGVRWRAVLAEVAASADILITMLPGSREEREVMAGPGGVLAVMPSTVWVDMTSSSPAAGRELAAAAQARGVGVLAAPGWEATGIRRRRCGSLGPVPPGAGSARRPAAHHPRRRQRCRAHGQAAG